MKKKSEVLKQKALHFTKKPCLKEKIPSANKRDRYQRFLDSKTQFGADEMQLTGRNNGRTLKKGGKLVS